MESTAKARWISAGITLGNDPAAKVKCPQCGDADLAVFDAVFDGGTERWMQCPACHALNTLLIRTAGKAPATVTDMTGET
jgi:phage FluMu protein Com